MESTLAATISLSNLGAVPFNQGVEIPRRYSLATQAAASIRECIFNGTWVETLPSERELCSLLHVSRPTLRAAIQILRHEELLEVRSRQSTRVLKAGVTKSAPSHPIVVMLTGRPVDKHGASTLSFIGKLQLVLSKNNFQLVIFDSPQLEKSHPQKVLEKVTAQYPQACYILMSVSESAQMFFSQRNLPAMVCGSRFPQVRLPSSDWNYIAIGRHAAGVFLNEGHRRLCVVRTPFDLTGYRQGEEGFKEVAARHGDVTCLTVRNDGGAVSLHRAIRDSFAKGDRPSGVFVLDPYDCITVLFALQSLGIRVPEDVSVVSLDEATVFNVLPFRVASYNDSARLAEKSAKLVMKLVLNHYVPPNENLIMLDFDPGQTLSRCRN